MVWVDAGLGHVRFRFRSNAQKPNADIAAKDNAPITQAGAREDEDSDISMVDSKQVESIARDLGWRAVNLSVRSP
jgi:hypothetical protein